MRRMVSYSPVYGEISEHLDDFVLDEELSLDAFYTIKITDNGKVYSSTLQTAGEEDFSYASYANLNKTIVVLSWHADLSKHISVSANNVISEGAIIEVNRIY